MPKLSLKLGSWYPSKEQIRKHFGEYWKGILVGKKQIAIISSYRWGRRAHYRDGLDLDKMVLFYIGEGRSGDQKMNSRNLALKSAIEANVAIDVFFDCGDIFKPKSILYVGKWDVIACNEVTQDGRSVFQFELRPGRKEVEELLRFTFSKVGADEKFEKELAAFSKARAEIYANNPHILRSRDSISGEIGEYFSVSRFNEVYELPLVRLKNSYRDIDAVQVKSGKRYAIKTISKFPGATSNIWSKDIEKAVDYFLIVLLDPLTLSPKFICSVSAKKVVATALKRDNYQNTHKIHVSKELLRKGEFILGDKKEWIR